MIGRLDLDEAEAKRCNNHNVGKKLPSYKKGFQAGVRDAKATEIEKRAKNPYLLTEEMRILLKKRARWEMGYQQGWEVGRKQRKVKKVRRRDD